MKKTVSKKSTRVGKIIPNGVKPELHEMDTILYFTNLGKDVELIPASHTPGNKTPDFIIDGLKWEAKTPTNSNRSAIERTFYRASCQSCNVIIDLRRLRHIESTIDILEKCFKNTRKVRKMCIITKSSTPIFYSKKR
jgi:hypothetical protein